MFRRPTVFALCAFAARPLARTARRGASGSRSRPTIGVYIPTTELVKAANGEEFKQEVGVWPSAAGSGSP